LRGFWRRGGEVLGGLEVVFCLRHFLLVMALA
jgi:hypothetical protein